MLTIKNQVKTADIFWALFCHQFMIPNILIYLGIYGFILFRGHYAVFLTDHLYLWFLISCLTLVLYFLFWVVLSNLAQVGLNSLLGKYKSSFLPQEITFDDKTMTTKTGAAEGKHALAAVLKMVETKKRFFLFKSGGTMNILAKSHLSSEEESQIREIFKKQYSRFLSAASRFSAPLAGVLLLTAVWGVTQAHYHIQRRPGDMQAVWKDDELYVGIPVYAMGSRDELWRYLSFSFHPYGQKEASDEFYRPHEEMNFFAVKNGVPQKIEIAQGQNGRIQTIGSQIYLVAIVKRKPVYSLFDGKTFKTLTDDEVKALRMGGEKDAESVGWKSFRLWDENAEEEQDPDQNQDYTMTARLKSGDVKIHMQSQWISREEGTENQVYTLEGFKPPVQPLITINGAPQDVGRAEFLRTFPKGSNDGPEGEL